MQFHAVSKHVIMLSMLCGAIYAQNTEGPVRTLGLTAQVAPQQQHYQYVVVFGAHVSDWLHDRLAYLEQLVDDGMTFDQLVFLTCHKKVHLPKYAQGTVKPTEIAYMRYVFEQSRHAQYFAKRAVWVDTDPKFNAWGKPRNVDTAATIKAWLAPGVEPGSILAISNQPYVTYQDVVFRKYLPDSFYLETVGSAAPAGVKSEELLHVLELTLRHLPKGSA